MNNETRQLVSWEEVDTLSRSIAEKFANTKITCVLGIARGGLIPATIISHELGVPLIPVVWQTRDGEYKTDLNPILDSLDYTDNILIVDDISDSGKTLSQMTGKIFEYVMDRRKPIIVCTAALHQKPKTTYMVHHFGQHIDDSTWVVYPWEK